MTPNSRLDTMVDDLRAYVGDLERELARARRALNALTVIDGGSEQGASRDEQAGLNKMLRDVLESASPAPIDAKTASQELAARGWTTESKDPVNTVRSALARLVSSGEVEKMPKRGQYRWVTTPEEPYGGPEVEAEPAEDGAAQPEDDEGWRQFVPADADADPDPWGSAPASSSNSSDWGEEPPF